MSVFSGPQGEGAMRAHRAARREQAVARAASATARSCGHLHTDAGAQRCVASLRRNKP